MSVSRTVTVCRKRMSTSARRWAADPQAVAPKPKLAAPGLPPAPKKRFSVTKALFSTAVAASAVYGATLYAATKNDKVLDFVIDKQLPYHEQLLDFIEKGTWQDVQHYVESLGSKARDLELKSKDQLQEITHRGEQILEDTRKKFGDQITPAEQLQKVETVHKPAEHLPLIALRGSGAVDAAVQSTIESFNDLIRSIDIGAQNSPQKEQLIKVISDNVTSLAQKLDSFTSRFQQEVEQKLKVSHTDLLAAYTKKELELTESMLYQFNTEKAHLEAKLAAQVKTEVDAAKEAISLAAVNAVSMMRIEQTRQFEQLVKRKIDAERDGRLANLAALNQKVAQLEQFSESLEAQLVSNHNKALLAKSVGNLKSVLAASEGDAPKALAQYVDAIAQVSGSVKSELLDLTLAQLRPLVATDTTHTVWSTSQVLAQWESLTPELRSASLLPPNAGLLGHLSSMVFSKLLWPVKGAKPNGKDIESVIGRIDASLARGQLDVAVEEAANLKGWPRKLADDWVQHSRKRLEVQFLVDVLDSEARTV